MVGQQQYAGSVTCSDLDVNKDVIFCMLFKKNICVISLNYLYYNRGAWQWLDEKAACCQQYAGSVTCSDLDVNTPAAPPAVAAHKCTQLQLHIQLLKNVDKY